MSLLQRTLSPLESKQRTQLRTSFWSGDNFFIPVSIFLGSSLGASEILGDMIGVLRAYGFADISRISQAPGSFYIQFRAGFESHDRDKALRRERELKADLVSKKLPKSPARRQAQAKLKESIRARAKRGFWTLLVAGSVMVGTIIGDAAKDLVRDEMKSWVREEVPRVLQSLDRLVTKELPPGKAAQFHNYVNDHIRKSPEKTEIAPPPED
jgi:hypothetical protein